MTHSIFHNKSFYTVTNSGIGGNYKWAFTKLYDIKFGVSISKYDRDMNEIGRFDLENGEKLFGPLEPELFLLNNRLCLAYFQNDGNNSSFSLYLAFVNDNDLTIKSPKKICSIQQKNVGIFKLESVIEGGLFYFAKSPDHATMHVVCKTSPNSMQLFVIDSSLEILHQHTVHTANSEYDVTSAILTNNGFECLLLESKEERKAICITPQGKSTDIRLNGYGNLSPHQTSARLSRDGKRIFICSSTTLSGEDDTHCNGLLLWQLDCNTAKLSKPQAYEFPPEVLETISEKGGGGRHRKEYFIYNFRPDVIELDNGEIVILGSPANESVSSTAEPTWDRNKNMSTRQVLTTTIEVGPVVTFFPGKDGKTFEYVAIPRKIQLSRSAHSGSGSIQFVQSLSVSLSFSNFIATPIGDEIVVLYDDDENNLNNEDLEKLVTGRKPGNLVLAEATIGKDKKLQYRKQIGKNLKGTYTYYLGNAIPTSSSSIIFPAGKQGSGFNARKIFYSNWCFLDIK